MNVFKQNFGYFHYTVGSKILDRECWQLTEIKLGWTTNHSQKKVEINGNWKWVMTDYRVDSVDCLTHVSVRHINEMHICEYSVLYLHNLTHFHLESLLDSWLVTFHTRKINCFMKKYSYLILIWHNFVWAWLLHCAPFCSSFNALIV